MKQVQKTIFVTDDGFEFFTAQAAWKHERKTALLKFTERHATYNMTVHEIADMLEENWSELMNIAHLGADQ